MVSDKFLLNFAHKKGDLKFDTQIKTDNVVIIDFYNIYCSIIQFNKYKLFTSETVLFCIKKIMDNFNTTQQIIIVSKNIFEFSDISKKKLLGVYPNMIYIVVEDNYVFKTHNKERDDYTCLLLQYLFSEKNMKSVIITNDNFSNFNNLIKDVKPFTLKIFKELPSTLYYSADILNGFSACLKYDNINKIKFTFQKSK